MTVARTARERARSEITAEILAAARAQLRETGPGELSLRAVARDVGMVSSAVYRYFASRDELLTALIIAAYDELGAAAEAADDAVEDRTDHLARWMATCQATRDWSVAHPARLRTDLRLPRPRLRRAAGHRHAGDPGDRPARRDHRRRTPVRRAPRTATPPPAEAADPSDVVADAMAFIAERSEMRLEALPELVMRTLMAWSTIFGTLSFELFGHLVGSVSDYEDYFEQTTLRLAGDLGLA